MPTEAGPIHEENNEAKEEQNINNEDSEVNKQEISQENIPEEVKEEIREEVQLEINEESEIAQEINNDIPEVAQQDIPPVTESFDIPKVIKSVKQASNKLLEKVHNIDFKGMKDKVLEWMRQHTIATLIGASALLALGATLQSTKEEDKEINVEAIAGGVALAGLGALVAKNINKTENDGQKEFINETTITKQVEKELDKQGEASTTRHGTHI